MSNDTENDFIFINKDDGLKLNGDAMLPDDTMISNYKFLPENYSLSPNRENPTSSILINNVPPNIFDSKELKARFEQKIRNIEPTIEVKFLHIKACNRIRIILPSTEFSNKFYDCLHGMQIFDQILHCSYFTPFNYKTQRYLSLPPPTKLFLISPPASPPEGWEVVLEKEPVINHELIAAINRLGKQDTYELYPGTDTLPSIRVKLCSETTMDEILHPKSSINISRTPSPFFQEQLIRQVNNRSDCDNRIIGQSYSR